MYNKQDCSRAHVKYTSVFASCTYMYMYVHTLLVTNPVTWPVVLHADGLSANYMYMLVCGYCDM